MLSLSYLKAYTGCPAADLNKQTKKPKKETGKKEATSSLLALNCIRQKNKVLDWAKDR